MDWSQLCVDVPDDERYLALGLGLKIEMPYASDYLKPVPPLSNAGNCAVIQGT
jgi:hypothetical protein